MIVSIILLAGIAGMVAYLVYGVQKNKKAQAEVQVEIVDLEVKKPKQTTKPKATQAAKPKAKQTPQTKSNSYKVK